MKKFLSLLFLLLPPLLGTAQVSGFDEFFRKYTGSEECTTMEFTGALLQMMAGGDDESFLGVTAFKMLTADNANESIRRDASSLASGNDYKVLINVTEGGSGFRILHREKRKGISEYIMLALEGSGVTVIYVEGEIDFKNIARLSKLGQGND